MSDKIYVGNISSTTTDVDLFNLFSKTGGVFSAKISMGANNKKTQYGYVIMENEIDVEKAIKVNNNFVLKGSRLIVIKAHPIDQNSSYFSNQNRYRRFQRR